MNFAIEVPGEASPLTLPELGRALHAATSSDHAQRQSAGKQLQAWEAHQDYFPSLQTAFLDKSLPHEIRFLAIILLKNGIDRYWRQTAKHAITPAGKQLIRSRLLQGTVGEEDRAFALHNALVMAKVVRIDWPHDWPDALPGVVALARTTRHGDQAHLGGALLVLLRVVKELGTARLVRSQRALQQATPELVQLLGEIYTERTAYWMDFLSRGRGDEDDADLAMQNSLTALKILRRLVTVSYERPHEDAMVQGFWSLSQSQFDQFLGSVGQDSGVPAPFQDIVGKHLIQFTKLHIQMCELHPASFPLLPNSIPLVKAYWALVKDFSEVFEKSGGIRQTAADGPTGTGKSKFEGPLLERLALKGLLLIRGCVSIAYRPVQTFKYRSPEMKIQEKGAVEAVRSQLLTKPFLLDMIQVIISKLFIFRKSDLDAWEEDPEEWENQERNEGQAWEWAVRPCAERLLVDLITHYEELGQPLLSYCELATKVDMDIVTKEAAYTALGCAAQNVYKTFDFDRFLSSTLVKDAQVRDPMAKLVRRRIAILLSQWIPVKVSMENRPTVYEIFRHLMNPADEHNDEVVRITAARQLKWVAEDFQFSGEQFLPFAGDVFNLLINLLGEVNVDETKLAVLETTRAIVSRLETHVSQFGDGIMATLPKLWEAAEAEEYMIKQSVLAITSALVMAMRGDSQRYQGFIIPLLREAMNPESALHLHLIEESVELWKSVLMQSVPPLSPDLAQMVHLALPLLEYDSDVASQCLEVVRSYIFLAPEAMLADDLRRPALAALARVLDSRSREQTQLGARSIEQLVRAAEELGGGARGVTVIVQDMLETGLLRSLRDELRRAWEASQTTGPNRRTSNAISTVRQTDDFALLARLALADPAVFATAVAGLDGLEGLDGDGSLRSAWSWLVPQWFAAFDGMADIERKKLSALALTRLTELPSPAQELVLERLQDYLAMWTSVVMELRDGADGAATSTDADTLVWPPLSSSSAPNDPAAAGASSSEYDTPLDVREREVAARDPVHTVSLYPFVMQRLHSLVQRTGGEAVFQAEWAVNVDSDVLAGFQRLARPGTD